LSASLRPGQPRNLARQPKKSCCFSSLYNKIPLNIFSVCVVCGDEKSDGSHKLWSYNNETKLLSNKNGTWLYQTKTWMIPELFKEGYVEDISSGQVLTVKGNETGNGTEVLLQNKNDLKSQKWHLVIPN
jgi:hypothetical protein